MNAPRMNTVTAALQTEYERRALMKVRALVEDSGGRWSREVARIARFKVRSTLRDEPPILHVLQYHAGSAIDRWERDPADSWKGDSADQALRRAVKRASHAIGPRVQQIATKQACCLLMETAGLPGMLSEDAADVLRDKVG